MENNHIHDQCLKLWQQFNNGEITALELNEKLLPYLENQEGWEALNDINDMFGGREVWIGLLGVALGNEQNVYTYKQVFRIMNESIQRIV